MTTPRIESIAPDHALPERTFETTNVEQFLYNAALWNAHRIHFDQPYATGEEAYPGLVVAGPLMGEWLGQCALDWLAQDGRLISLEYSNRKACFVGETLRSGGTVRSVDPSSGRVELDLYIKNEADEVVTPGKAVVELDH